MVKLLCKSGDVDIEVTLQKLNDTIAIEWDQTNALLPLVSSIYSRFIGHSWEKSTTGREKFEIFCQRMLFLSTQCKPSDSS